MEEVQTYERCTEKVREILESSIVLSLKQTRGCLKTAKSVSE